MLSPARYCGPGNAPTALPVHASRSVGVSLGGSGRGRGVPLSIAELRHSGGEEGTKGVHQRGGGGGGGALRGPPAWWREGPPRWRWAGSPAQAPPAAAVSRLPCMEADGGDCALPRWREARSDTPLWPARSRACSGANGERLRRRKAEAEADPSVGHSRLPASERSLNWMPGW